MGALFTVPIIEATAEEFLAWRREQGVQLIGSSAHARLDYRALKPRKPWILALGSEQRGLPEAFLAGCDSSVALPMRGHASSLNLASAAAVLLYQYAQEETGLRPDS
jgi:TrmH family RNA methyltransferase